MNVDEVVRFLTHAFFAVNQKAHSKLGNAYRFKNTDGNWETTQLYDYQVNFSYLIDDIQRGPAYIAVKRVQEANELIAELNDLVTDS